MSHEAAGYGKIAIVASQLPIAGRIRDAWRNPRALSAAGGIVCALGALSLNQSAGDAKRVAEANDLGRSGRYAEAAAAAREAIDRPPADARALVTLSTANRRLGRLPAASAVLASAAQRYPNSYDVHLRWAVVLAEQEREATAIRELNRALALNPLLDVPSPFSVPGEPR